MCFCLQRKADPFYPTVGLFLEHLLQRFKTEEAGYSKMNVIRSSISTMATIDHRPAGQHHLVKRFLKAVFLERPSLPRYQVMWDPEVVLKHITNLGINKKMKLIDLSKKITILLLLLSGQRCQTIQTLSINNLHLTKNSICFYTDHLTKTSRPGHHQSTLNLIAYQENRKLCIVTAIKVYLRRTAELRGSSTQLLITTTKPHRPATRDTVRRWVRETLQAAGIDIEMFKPHSTRGASMSKAAKLIDIDLILKTVGWKKESTFRRFYNKPILSQEIMTNAILSNN